jgi:hypothetical protein
MTFSALHGNQKIIIVSSSYQLPLPVCQFIILIYSLLHTCTPERQHKWQTTSHKIMTVYNEQYSQSVTLSTPFTQHRCTVHCNINEQYSQSVALSTPFTQHRCTVHCNINEQYSQSVALSTPFTQHRCTVHCNITTNSFMDVIDIATAFTPDIIKHQNFTLKTMFQGWLCSNLKTSNAIG